MALLCVTRHVTSGESAHHLRCVLPYYAVRDIRHGVRCPGNDVNRFMCVPGQILLSRFSISPLFEQPGQKHPRKIANSALPHNIRHHTSAEFRGFGITDNGRLQGGCPGSQKEAEITNRDSEICPGNRVNRLPSSPEHQLRIDRALQCSTGMRPYRDSDIPTEVWDSPRDQYYLPSFGASCLAWRITASGKPAWM